MKRTAKIWLIAAGVLVVLGPLMMVGALAGVGFDMNKLSGEEVETNTFEVGATFDEIAVNVDTTDVAFAPAEDKACSVVCTETEQQNHSVTVKDGTLLINSNDTREWYEKMISFSFQKPTITVYLPEQVYRKLTIETDTGDINIPEDFTFDDLQIEGNTGRVISAAAVNGDVDIRLSTGNIWLDDAVVSGSITAKTSTGNVTMTDVSCKGVDIETSTGNIGMSDVMTDGNWKLRASTGNVQFNACDAETISVKTSTGNVTGTLLTDKIFITDTSTGTVDVPKTTTGGRCEITTSTGSIKIGIE